MCDCADGPTPVTDWARGDVVCCACGVVVEGHILDDTPTWAETAAPSPKRRRTGDAAGGKERKLRCVVDPKEASLMDGIKVIDHFVGRFGLSTTSAIATTAKELFTDLHAVKGVRSDTRQALAAAAVYYGCKMENAGRELRLVSQVCEVDAKALNAAASEYKESLHAQAYHPKLFAGLQAGKLIDMFLDRLRLPADQRRRVWRAAHALDESLVDLMDCGRKPRTICSGILYMAVQQEAIAGVTKKDITEACSVCQQTLDKVVTQLRASLTAA